ncbi:MAG: squalene synthase HpnC [Hyphomicrobiales bacterium]
MSAGAVIETPSGKGAGDENFPVGSFLLPKRLRPHVAKYYAFARAIDDIADNPSATPKEKLARLDAMDLAIQGKQGRDDPALAKAWACRESMLETNVDLAHARDLISAFRQDSLKNRYHDWADLMDYCNRSASPVGRYLLELHGEDKAGFAQSDALCNALQVINHLQDCAQDYAKLDRVYLPGDWLAAEGATVEMLSESRSPKPLRRVIDRCIAASRTLMEKAHDLPGVLKSRHLAMESAVIVEVADRLLDALESRDPVAERVELSKPQFALCAAKGAVAGFLTAGKKLRDRR